MENPLIPFIDSVNRHKEMLKRLGSEALDPILEQIVMGDNVPREFAINEYLRPIKAHLLFVYNWVRQQGIIN